MIAPLYKKMSSIPQVEQLVVALTTARSTFQQEGIPYISFSDLAATNTEARKVGEKLIEGQYQHPDIPVEESLAYMGLSYMDLVHEYGEEQAQSLFAQQGRRAFLPKRTFLKLFNEFKPDLVVATNSPRAERAALESARQLGIPSLCLVDLFTEFELRGFLSEPGYGSKICVLNELAKEILISAGRPADEIVITGNPAFDSLTSKENLEAAHHYRKIHNLENQMTILWARSTLPEDLALTDETENKLVDLALKNPQLTVIIRPHPNEPPRSVPQAPNIILSGKKDQIAKILHVTDVVCTLYSTVAVEAFLIGKKVIQITGTEMFKSFNCVSAGFATGVSNMMDLENEINRIASSKNIYKTTAPRLDATSKVKDVMIQLLQTEGN